MFCDLFVFPENLAVYDMWKSILEPSTPQMRTASWIPKSTDIYSEYVTRFVQQQQLYERT